MAFLEQSVPRIVRPAGIKDLKAFSIAGIWYEGG